MRHRRLVADETARAVAQHRLFFAKDECHWESSELGKSSGRSNFSTPFRSRASEANQIRESRLELYAPGRSRIRFATMPSITSLVPPSIELALVRSQARGGA